MSRGSGALYLGTLPGDIREREVVEDLFCNGHQIERSVNEGTALVSGSETACSLVLDEEKFPVSSANGSVPETKEIIEHQDDNEKSLEVQQCSKNNDGSTSMAVTSIVPGPVERDENVLDIAKEHEAEHSAFPSMENAAAKSHMIIKPGNGNADNVASQCVEGSIDLTAEHAREHAREHVPSCLTANDDATTKEVFEQETMVESSEGAISTPVTYLELKPVTADVVNTTIAEGDSTSCLINKVSTGMEFELETPGPRSSESSDNFTLAADSSIVQRLVEGDENIHDISREHEAEHSTSLSNENVAANSHEIMKPETEHADNVTSEYVEGTIGPTAENGTEHVPPCSTGNDGTTTKEVIEQETEVENFEQAISSSVSCSKLKPMTDDVNDTTIAGGDGTSCSNNEVSTCVLLELETCGQSSESTDDLILAADSSIVQRLVESDENVLIAREHKAEYEASPSVENIAADIHDIVKPETVVVNAAVECVGDAVDLTTGNVPSCLEGNDDATAKEVIGQETEVENFDVAVSLPLSCSKLKPITEDVSDNTIARGDDTSCSIDKVITSMEFELKAPDPQSSESTDSLTLSADSSIVRRLVENDENILAKEHETEYKASPSMENIANSHEIIQSETGNADNVAVGCVEDALHLTTEYGTEHVPSCLTVNEASAAKEFIERKTEVENSEGAVSSPSVEDIADTDVIVKSENGDADNVTVGCVEDALDLKRECGTEHVPSCLTVNEAIAAKEFIELKTEVENSEGNVSSPSKSETGDADNVAMGCVEDASDLTTECGTEHVPSCLTVNEARAAEEFIEQKTEVDNSEGAVSSALSCSKLKPIDGGDYTGIAGGNNTRCPIDKVNPSMGFELEASGPQSSDSADRLALVTDSSIVHRPIESVENVLSRGCEMEYLASPSMENVVANIHEITKPDTRGYDNVAVEYVEGALDLTTEHGTEHVPSCLTGNDVVTANEITEQETDVEGFEGPVNSSVRGSEAKCITDENDTAIATTNSLTDKVMTSMEFDLKTPSAQDVSTLQGDDNNSKPETSIVNDVCLVAQSLQSGPEKESEVGTCSVISSRRYTPCNDVSSGSDVSDALVTEDKFPHSVVENLDRDEHLASAQVNSYDKFISQETKDGENSLKNEKSTSLPENSCADSVAVQVVEPLTRPFHFLIRIPRYEDSKMKEQIRKAQLLVEEKTQHRDAFKIEVQKYKANCLGYAAEYEAAMSESRTLKKSVRDKRAAIESLQSVMNKVKNAISVDDIDTRIHGMEHMIEHETLPLKEEKLLIREIKQLKQLREQLSSNIGSHDELQQALNNRDQIEESLKVLKKELELLKDSVLKADAVARALEKKYEDENRKVKDVQTQYAAANNVRQDAYAHLQCLRRQLFEKNQLFRMYKHTAAAASDYAAKRERAALHHLCVNQVESIMELWNRDNEVREEYIRCNMKSTLRRLGTMDGRSLGPDEQPHVLTSYADERVDRLVSNPVKSFPTLRTQNLEQDVAEPVDTIMVGNKIKVEGTEQKAPSPRLKKQDKHVPRNDLATASGREITEDDIRQERDALTQQELDQAREVDERRVDDEAKLKEQRRLEERAKALEALERKKRNAEKAQMRAELRAQKEAEQREKEREKRLRKKERRKGSSVEVSDGNNSVETSSNCESWMGTMKEPEVKENPAAVSKRPQKISQFTKQSKAKSIPPPLRNRGRKKLQQWMWVIFTCVLVVALFLLGNVGFFSNLSNLRRRNSGF